MSIAKIQTGDKVKVIAGNFKGHVGQVIKIRKKVYPDKSVRKFVYISNLKKLVKYRKRQRFQGQEFTGSMFEVDRPIDISNVMLVDENGKTSRVQIKFVDNKKVRVLKTTGQVVEKQKLEKNSQEQDKKE